MSKQVIRHFYPISSTFICTAVLYALLAVKTNHLTGSMLCSASHIGRYCSSEAAPNALVDTVFKVKKKKILVLLRFYLETIKHILKRVFEVYIFTRRGLHFKQLERLL